jgi:hypothetical protein
MNNYCEINWQRYMLRVNFEWRCSEYWLQFWPGHIMPAASIRQYCYLMKMLYFFSAFAKLRKGNISIIMFVRLSLCPIVRTEHLLSHWTVFHEILHYSIAEKIKILTKSEKSKGQFMWRWLFIFFIITRHVPLRMRTKFIRKSKYVLCFIKFFSFKNRALYEATLKNIIQRAGHG